MNRWAPLVTAIILFTGIWVFHSVSTLPGNFHGDEIHYLAITLSLAHDGDLNVLNNYASPEMTVLGASGTLPHLIYNENGTGYSSHSPGLPALLVLPYLSGGRTGTVLFLTLIGVFAVMQVYYMAVKLRVRTGVAVFAALFTGFNLPFIMMSGKIFPDATAALFLSLSVHWMLIDTRRFRPVAGCAFLSLLPWLHVKYAVFSIAVFLIYLFFIRRRFKQHVYTVIPAIISLSGFIWLQCHLFGELFYMLRVKGGGFIHPWPGIAGLLFDREAGLLVFAPIFIPAFIALLFNWRRPAVLNATALMVIGYWIMSGAWIDWHSGHCPPARYLIPVLPILGLFSAVWLNKPGPRYRNHILAILWLLSLVQIVGIAFTIPENAIVHYDGVNKLWNHFAPGHLEYAAPSWLYSTSGTPWSFAAMLLFTAFIAVCISFRLSTKMRAVLAIAFLLTGTISAVTGMVTEKNYREQLALTPLPDYGPELKSPRNGTVWWGEFPELEWSSVPGAEGYLYGIEFPDGRILEAPQFGRTRVAFTEGIEELFPMGRYCLYIIPLKGQQRGIPSDTHCFELR